MSKKSKIPESPDPQEVIHDMIMALKDPTKRKIIEDVLASYRNLSKTEITNRLSQIALDLDPLIGKNASSGILMLVTLIGAEADRIYNIIKKKEKKKLIQEIHAKFSPIFGGVANLYSDDWYRISWKNSFDGISKEPVLQARFFKRNGEEIVLESSASTWTRVFFLISEELANTFSVLEKISLPEDIKKDIERLEENLEKIQKKVNFVKVE